MFSILLKFCISKQSNRKPGNRRKIPQIPRQMVSDNTVYSVQKLLDKGVVTSTSIADGLYSYQLALSDLNEVASFTSIYDQYRIDRVQVNVMPVTLPNNTSLTALPYAFCAIVTDYDDSATLASFALALNYQNCRVIGPGQGHSRTIIPHTNLAGFDGATAYAISKPAPWIDCANTGVTHYGIKICVKQSTSTFVSGWYVWMTYQVSFRRVR